MYLALYFVPKLHVKGTLSNNHKVQEQNQALDI